MKYNQSPLPFQGQKRRFLAEFRNHLKSVPEGAVIVDLFGGSGILSHTAKQERPDLKVVYNDFDNFSQRLANVERTNKVIEDIRMITDQLPADKRIPENIKTEILNRISQEAGFVDYVTLSASLLFSGNFALDYEQLSKQYFYNAVRKSKYSANGYLEGVEVVSKDYKQLFKEYSSNSKVIFLIDPPYLSTDCSTYGSDKYWKLGDYLDVLTTMQRGNYFYFTSNKSQVLELCEWIASHTNYENPFKDSAVSTTRNGVNYTSSYTDIMAVKLNI